jgi:ubiquinone/menaquinone biosynthesis C-methylase UbiE
MEISDASVDRHYGHGDLLEKIVAGLASAGKGIDTLTIADLAPLDGFHIRGRAATLEMAHLANLKTTDRILDVGCGLGGSVRCLTHQFGCKVAGLDITDEYITVARVLTQWVGLDDRVEFRQGSALEIPYRDAEFDALWIEHVQMNIADKRRFYSELARVLKPGGKLLFHELFSGSGEAPIYPVPWAEDESISILATEDQARESMEKVGLTVENWSGKVRESVEFFERAVAWIKNNGQPPFGIHLLMGSNFSDKMLNLLCNLKEDRLSVVLGMARKN